MVGQKDKLKITWKCNL